MKQILSRDMERKKKRRNQIIVGVVLIGLMFFSVVGYSFVGREDEKKVEKLEYNGFEFVKNNNFWILNINNLNLLFRYHPTEIEKISYRVNSVNSYYQEPLYISSKNSEASSEIYTNLNQIVKRIQYACLDEEDCDEGLPIKTCDDNFIIIRESGVSEIKQDGRCVFIQGPSQNLTMLADEFLFKIFGIE